MATQKHSTLIRSVEVKYYRSINNAKIYNCASFNVITGPNDIGKSNLLRALHLFFNEVGQDGEDIDFSEEFSQKRLEQVRKESVKGKQFVQITVEFNRGPFFTQTLPERFRVTKTWYRDSPNPDVTDDLQGKVNSGKVSTTIIKARASLKRFLGRISFTYIPAIKDQDIFDEVFSDLQEVMFDSSETAGSVLTSQIEAFNGELENQARELRTDFTESTGIKASISLPQSHRELFQSFTVKTDGIAGEDVSLSKRGDGIRVRFIPAILNYIAERSSNFHIWGFEEPENSMEYKRAFELCTTMRDRYSHTAQIFVTTHSPAFIDLSKDNQSIYLAKRDDDATVFRDLTKKNSPGLFEKSLNLTIAEELGHIALLGDMHDQLQSAMERAEAIHKAASILRNEMASYTKPLVLTEGKTDAVIISEAWRRLRSYDSPFNARSCNTLPETESNEAAGATVLAGALRTVRSDASQLTIGLFDHDAEGVAQFKLDANFSVLSGASGIKVHKNSRSYALLLPAPEVKRPFIDCDNLCTEFLFDDIYLAKTVEGFGLGIEFEQITTVIRNRVVSKSASTAPEHMKIVSGKTHFATKVVPTLPDEAFVNFEPLIARLESIISASSAG